jgi:hypothetical protein
MIKLATEIGHDLKNTQRICDKEADGEHKFQMATTVCNNTGYVRRKG